MTERCRILLAGFCALLFAVAARGEGAEQGGQAGRISVETSACIDCHKAFNPGIIEDWLGSRHARTIPGEALARPKLERRVSSDTIPEKLRRVVVGCYECHALNPASHKDNFEHFDHRINTIVSPNDCRTCHKTEAEQYGRSKKAHASRNLSENPVYTVLVDTIAGTKEIRDGKIVARAATTNAKNETCYACHGTEVGVKGLRKVSTSLGDIDVPDLTNVPNHGVGRINPDGSLGACSPCHARHAFSIAVARKPHTCAQCHVEPDAPAWNVYRESKHGNIFFSGEKAGWNFDQVPWVPGRDFKTPTCAGCHNSLVATSDGEVIHQRSHDFGERLWVRIFGSIYSHPQPKDGRTYLIRNKDGLSLPTAFTGEPAGEYLLDGKAQACRQAGVERICASCHGSNWTGGHFEKFHSTVAETDAMTKTATLLLVKAWDRKQADRTNPFDEYVEQKWLKQWLFYGNSTRYSSAMGGPDYAAFKNGWWEMTRNLEEMRYLIDGVKSKRRP